MDGLAGTRLRALPQLQRLLELPEGRSLTEDFPRVAVVEALRTVLDEVRTALRLSGGAVPDPLALLGRARATLDAAQSPCVRRVINATGIVLHTNLGRAPLAPEVAKAVAEAARGYCNIEFDLETGERGSRTQGIEPLLQRLTGAEAAFAVNNCAAAVLLALSGLAGEGGGVARSSSPAASWWRSAAGSASRT